MKEKFRYKKEMGQHFIFDPILIEQLADASLASKEDGVLEIGPGRGTLTTALAKRARKVITVELDRTLIHDLHVTMALYQNVEIIEGDILRADIAALVQSLGTPCRLAANLPYNITTPLIEKILHLQLPFESLAIMVQKEVGARMMASAGAEGYGPFSILIFYYAQVQEAIFIPAECFTPPPKVDSSFMLLTMRKEPPVSVLDEALFFRVVNASFAMRRKTLLNNLLAAFPFSREEITDITNPCEIMPEKVRAEQLTPEQFALLTNAIYQKLHKIR